MKAVNVTKIYGLKRHSWWSSIGHAWPDLRPALSLPEFRALAWLAAAALVIIVGIDVVAGMMKYKGALSPEATRFFRISEQGSLGEFVGYFSMQMAMLFTLLVACLLRSPLHAMITGLTEYLMMDDMFMLHETVGKKIGEVVFSGQNLFQADALGELCFGALFCGTLAGLFVVATRASAPYLRSLAVLLLGPICLLALCAVGVDFLHSLVSRDNKFLDGIVALIEDGGELSAMLLLLLAAGAQWLTFASLAPDLRSVPGMP